MHPRTFLRWLWTWRNAPAWVQHLGEVATLITAGFLIATYFSSRADVASSEQSSVHNQISQLQSQYSSLTAQVEELRQERTLSTQKLDRFAESITRIEQQFKDWLNANRGHR